MAQISFVNLELVRRLTDELPGPSPLPGGALAVGLVLATFMNGDGVCYPSRETLAKKAGFTTRAVSNALRVLVDRNIIRIEHDPGMGNTYHLTGEPTFPGELSTGEQSFPGKQEEPVNPRSPVTPSPENLRSPHQGTTVPPTGEPTFPQKEDVKEVLKEEDNPLPPKTRKDIPPKPKAPDCSEGFEKFKKVYPTSICRRTIWTTTKAKFIALVKSGVPAADLIRAAKGYAASPDACKEQGKFVVGAQVFLGPQRRWEAFKDDDQAPFGGNGGTPQDKSWQPREYGKSSVLAMFENVCAPGSEVKGRLDAHAEGLHPGATSAAINTSPEGLKACATDLVSAGAEG